MYSTSLASRVYHVEVSRHVRNTGYSDDAVNSVNNVTRDSFTSPPWSLWAITGKPDTGRGASHPRSQPQTGGSSLSGVDRRRPEENEGGYFGIWPRQGKAKAKLSRDDTWRVD